MENNTQKQRLLFIDNIRWLIIVLVIMVHINVTYSSLGSWYYTEPAKLNTATFIFFIFFGIFTYRRDLLIKLPYETGIAWFRGVLLAGIPALIIVMLAGNAFNDLGPFTGGLQWQSAAFSAWESFICVGICMGLTVLYRDKNNRKGHIQAFLSDNAFGVYVFHTPLLVTITLIMKDWHTAPVIKWLAAGCIAIPVCFFTVFLIRRIPVMKKIF